MAMDLYMKGVSYRSIADSLKQFMSLKVTHVSVMKSAAAYIYKINQYVKQYHPAVSDTWHADEQMYHKRFA